MPNFLEFKLPFEPDQIKDKRLDRINEIIAYIELYVPDCKDSYVYITLCKQRRNLIESILNDDFQAFVKTKYNQPINTQKVFKTKLLQCVAIANIDLGWVSDEWPCAEFVIIQGVITEFSTNSLDDFNAIKQHLANHGATFYV